MLGARRVEQAEVVLDPLQRAQHGVQAEAVEADQVGLGDRDPAAEGGAAGVVERGHDQVQAVGRAAQEHGHQDRVGGGGGVGLAAEGDGGGGGGEGGGLEEGAAIEAHGQLLSGI